MSHFLLAIIIVIILVKSIINNSGGVQKRIKPLSFIILPILIVLYLFNLFQDTKGFSLISYIIFGVALIVGGFIGYTRSKSYSFTVNADGDVFYRKEIWDSIILIALLVTEGISKYVFNNYNENFFTIVNTALIILVTTSIVVRRIAMFQKYRKIRKNL